MCSRFTLCIKKLFLDLHIHSIMDTRKFSQANPPGTPPLKKKKNLEKFGLDLDLEGGSRAMGRPPMSMNLLIGYVDLKIYAIN